jgi:hypothetical protein
MAYINFIETIKKANNGCKKSISKIKYRQNQRKLSCQKQVEEEFPKITFPF